MDLHCSPEFIPKLRTFLTCPVLCLVCRAVVQVLALGYLLAPVCSWHSWWLVILFCKAMVVVAGVEAASRPGFTYRAMLHHTLAAVGAAVSLIITYYVFAVLPSGPPWLYIVPVVGILLGNVVNGVGTGLSVMVHECVTGARLNNASTVYIDATRMLARTA